MKKYDPNKIEKKWQKQWEKDGIYKTSERSKKPTQYVLDMFPYPSGEGLHVGHPKGYIATDIYSRFKRMNGYNVLHPMGWDAFGLPAENYAIKNKTQPQTAVKKNIKRYKEQLGMIGLDYDWSREINTTDPEYYKWTQWTFLQMYKKGLAYQSFEPINWCPSCKTGLANEDLETRSTDSGQAAVCERCGSEVEQRPMRQWVLKITDYADRLLKDLTDLDWPESIKESQRNWIGRSEGAEFSFPITQKNHYVLLHGFEGSPKKNFFPWLARELEKRGHSVEAPTLPKTKNPDIEKQVHHVLDTCHFTENTILVGHSLGGVVGQIITERLKTPIKKMVLVGSFTKPNFLDSKDQPFVDTFSWNLDLEKVRDNARRIVILHDQNDPIIPTREADILAEATAGELRSVVARKEHFCGPREPEILNACLEEVRVFTTRPDTIYGVTYMVLAPEHALVNELQSNITNWQEVTQYQKEANKKTQLERTAQDRAKSGVQLEGIYAKNPANGEEIPVYIADYVMTGYGTGAIMAVPAHDERDWEFAKVYGLPIRQVIRPVRVDTTNPPRKGAKVSPRYVVHCIVKHPSEDTVVTLRWKEHDWQTLIIGGIEKGESPEEAARREIYEETGYKNLILEDQLGDEVRAEFYAAHKEVNRIAYTKALVFRLSDLEKDDVTEEEKAKHEPVWTPIVDLEKTLRPCAELDLWIHRLKTGNYAYSGKGELVNSGGWDGMSSDHVQDLITQTASGVKRVTYRLNDWVFSRQRYWGEPIPLVHCEHCGVVPVPEKDLPVELPNVKKYEPTGTGESPLAAIDSWVNTTCPECGEKAKRETNTMPQWAGSCWYYLRYIDPSNTKQLVSEKKERHWMPVDMYVGGVEHATRHLIYARFWHKFLYDIDAVSTTEPFATLKNQGMIAGPDGRKMSKRYGNIINPDDVIKQHGADSFRTYEMFMGPFDQGGGWNTDNLIGVRRFLEKVWRLQEKVQDETTHTKTETDKKIEIRMHQTIQKVTEDIETFSFNTAISALMVLANQLDKQENIDRSVYTVLVQLLAPLAPHMCEELWLNVLKNKISVHTSDWPVYDETKLVEDTVTIVIQVNGKVRDEFEINKDMPGAEVIAQAKARDAVKRWVGDSKVAREIYVPGKLVSIATDTK